MHRPFLVVIAVLLGAGACGGEGSDGGSDPPAATAATAPSTLPADPTVDDLARVAGCEGITPFDEVPTVAPIRGGAASSGAACTIDGVEAHLFVRAPTEPPPGAVDSFMGGTVENIDRLVATGGQGGCGAWLAVGETWFALAEDPEVLEGLAAALGGGAGSCCPPAHRRATSRPDASRDRRARVGVRSR